MGEHPGAQATFPWMSAPGDVSTLWGPACPCLPPKPLQHPWDGEGALWDSRLPSPWMPAGCINLLSLPPSLVSPSRLGRVRRLQLIW